MITHQIVRRAAITAMACGALLTLTIAAAAAQTPAVLTFSTAVQVPLPGNAVADTVHTHSLACTSAGNCVAGVAYIDSGGHQHAVLIPQSGGTWGAAVQVKLPSDASTNPHPVINGVACPQAGSCVAVGNYGTTHTSMRAFIVTESGGHWGTAFAPHLMANAVSSQTSTLQGVACTGVGACEAAGGFADIEGHFEAMTVTESGGHWGTGLELKLPADAPTNSQKKAHLLGIACHGAGNCAAVGNYVRILNTARPTVAMGVTQSSGKLGTGQEIKLPNNATSGGFSTLLAVGCLTDGRCIGTGYYQAGTVMHAMTSTDTGGTWSQAAQLLAVPNTATFASLDANACRGTGSTSFCLSVGTYHTLGGSPLPLAVSWNGSSWSSAGPVPLPSNASIGGSAMLTAVACLPAPATYCEVLGTYLDSTSKQRVMAFSMP